MFQHNQNGGGAGDMKRQAHRDVLKHLIKMAQGMMMKGLGDSEEAGDKIKDALAEGSPGEEAQESPAEEKLEIDAGEGDSGDDEKFDDYRKKEMKRGNKSPLKDRKSMMIVSARAAPMPSMARGNGGKMGK